MGAVYWSSTWRCDKCGHEEPIQPAQDTRPVEAAHTCDPATLRAHKERQAQWWDGYRFAVENLSDELVQADADQYGTGWAARAGSTSIVIELGEGDRDA